MLQWILEKLAMKFGIRLNCLRIKSNGLNL
jgi:hypothetical protein